MAITFNFISIVTQDLASSLAFYRLLGLPIPAGAESEPHVDVEAQPGMRIGWDTAEMILSFDPEWTPAVGGNKLSLAFGCDSPAEVDATYASLIAAGYSGSLEPWDAVWGQRYATVLDPDGNGVDLYAALPA